MCVETRHIVKSVPNLAMTRKGSSTSRTVVIGSGVRITTDARTTVQQKTKRAHHPDGIPFCFRNKTKIRVESIHTLNSKMDSGTVYNIYRKLYYFII